MAVRKRAFLCHSSRHSNFVVEVAKYLTRNFAGGVFYYENGCDGNADFVEKINAELELCDAMVVFVGPDGLSEWQMKEVNSAQNLGPRHPEDPATAFVICLIARGDIPKELNLLNTSPCVEVPKGIPSEGRDTALKITEQLGMPFYNDGLPVDPYIFSYEKDIIKHFFDSLSCEEGKFPVEMRRRQLGGCPVTWPEVVYWEPPQENGKPGVDMEDVGEWRDRTVVVAALSDYHQRGVDTCTSGPCMIKEGFVFPEAGPREKLYFPRDKTGLRVGIVVSGGIAPGINAVIDGIVRRHELYAERQGWGSFLRIYGMRNGFLCFDDWDNAVERLNGIKTSQHAGEGGSILGTSRADDLIRPDSRRGRLQDIVRQLHDHHINILYVIGGDGSMKAAHALWTVAEEYRVTKQTQPISVVAIPKTMDNDILWVWQSFGFLSAVEKAREIIEQVSTEVESNPRLCVVQLHGSDSGFIVSHAVLASRARECDVALIPEAPFSMSNLADHMRGRMRRRGKTERIPRGLVVMAETAIPVDAMRYVTTASINVKLDDKEKRAIAGFCKLRDAGRRIEGQTPDHLRSGGLKIVKEGLLQLLQGTAQTEGDPRWDRLRAFTNEPRHLLRAIPPTCVDIVFGNRLGTLAVDNALAGYTDFMISQWLTEYVLVPLQLVVLGRKRIPTSGMFWKSVISKTGQPLKLVK